MTLSGREIQALLGSLMIQEHEPFVDSVRPVLSESERALVEQRGRNLQVKGADNTKPRDAPGQPLDRLKSGRAPQPRVSGSENVGNPDQTRP